MVRQRETAERQPPKRAKGIGFMIFGAVFSVMSLGCLLIGVNAVGYLMGAGTDVRVTVTESSVDSDEGGHAGSGYFEADGERVEVSLPYVEEGETVTARKSMIQWLPGSTTVITNTLDAKEDLQFLIGFLVLGAPGFIGGLGGWFFFTGRYKPGAQRVSLFGSRGK